MVKIISRPLLWPSAPSMTLSSPENVCAATATAVKQRRSHNYTHTRVRKTKRNRARGKRTMSSADPIKEYGAE